MKLIEKDELVRWTVDYFGIDLILEGDECYVATDADGKVFAYERRPTVCDEYEAWGNDHGGFTQIAKVDLEGMDWRETLRRYPFGG